MKNPTKTLLATVAFALLACAAFAPQAQAIPITGRIDFGGIANVNTGNPGTATAFTGFSNVSVSNFGAISPTGAYAGLGGTTGVTMNPFSFNPFVAPAGPLWTFMSGGVTYSFNLTGLSSVMQSPFGLIVSGYGSATITGGMTAYEATAGTFTISMQSGGSPNFSFSADSLVPEGGSALALLGMALLGVEIFRRKVKIA